MLGVERVGGRTFSSDSEGQWSLRAIPRGPFSPLGSGVQVFRPGPTSRGTTCAGAQAPRSEGPVLVLRLCPRCPETLNFNAGPTFPVCTGPTHYAAGPGSHPQRRKTTNVSQVWELLSESVSQHGQMFVVPLYWKAFGHSLAPGPESPFRVSVMWAPSGRKGCQSQQQGLGSNLMAPVIWGQTQLLKGPSLPLAGVACTGECRQAVANRGHRPLGHETPSRRGEERLTWLPLSPLTSPLAPLGQS